MNIDKKTTPNYIDIVVDSKIEYLKQLRKQGKEDGQENNKFSISSNDHSFDMCEYFYDKRDNEITISGNMISTQGNTYVYITIPLSDKLLIDILDGAIEKLRKIKLIKEIL